MSKRTFLIVAHIVAIAIFIAVTMGGHILIIQFREFLFAPFEKPEFPTVSVPKAMHPAEGFSPTLMALPPFEPSKVEFYLGDCCGKAEEFDGPGRKR